MGKLNKNKLGLILGTFFALMHALWALAVAIGAGFLQTALDWIFKIHFLKPVYVITAFSLSNAILLVIVTFVCGYIIGWVFAAIWNWIGKK